VAPSKRTRRLLFGALTAIVLALAALWMIKSRRPGVDGDTTGRPAAGILDGAKASRRGSAELDSASARGKAAVPETVPVSGVTLARIAAGPAHGALGGRVLNWSTHRGVPEAELSFERDGAVETTRTMSDGTFRFVPSKPGRYLLASIVADGYRPYAPELGHSPVVLHTRRGRAVEDVTVFLFPALDYRGEVRNASGEPVAGAEVRMFGATSGERALVGLQDRFVSDERGQFVFQALDRALLEARHPDHGSGRARVDGPVQLTHELVITLRQDGVPEAATIAGRVVDIEGEPVQDVRLVAEHEAADRASLHPQPQAMSEPDGSFVLSPVDPGTHRVTATRDGLASSTTSGVEAGTTGLLVTLETGHVIRGRVVDDAGEPVGAATVRVVRRQGVQERVVAALSVLDPRGAFEVPVVEKGNYEIRASAPGFAPSDVVRTTVPGAGEVVLHLKTGGRIHGRVTSEGSGEGIALARVSLGATYQAVSSLLPGLTSTICDADGEFELTGVPPGRHSVTAAAFRHDLRTLSGIEVEDGGEAGPLAVVLRPSGDETPTREIVGIGVALRPAGDGLVITELIPGGGAARAGLVVDDTIVAVDGVAVSDLGFGPAIQGIRGPEGTTVSITLRRKAGEGATVEVPRARVKY
jgi:hypothetical protein